MNDVQITVALTRHYADRLRLKGQPVRITDWRGEVHNLRVTHVSMPDKFGRCVVTANAKTAPTAEAAGAVHPR